MTVKSQRSRIRWRNAEEPWTLVTESAYTAAGDLAMRATYTNGTEVVREFYAYDHDECIIENRKCIIAMGGIACPCTNATDTAGNSWQFTYSANSTLTNEVFTSLRLCDSARQTNALARQVDAYSRPVGYDLAIGNTPCSRTRYGYDAEGRIATLAATNAANRGFQVEYLNESGYNYGYTLTTPNGLTLTRTVTRDPFRRSLTLDCTTRFNNVEVASFAYTFDAHSRPIARNNDRFTYNDRDEITSALIGTNRIKRAYDTIGNHVFCAFNSATNFYANNQLNQTTASYVCAPSADSGNNDVPSLFNGYDILSTNKFTWSAQGGHAECRIENEQCKIASGGIAHTGGGVIVRFQFSILHLNSPLAPPLPIERRTWCLKERHDFVYDDWNLIHETVTTVDANSTTNVSEIEYFWGPDLSGTLQGAGGVGGLLAVSMNGVFYFPVYDNLGNIVKYLDENGNIVASYIYDDFGQLVEKNGSMANIFHFLFSTKYFDSESDLYNYGYRFYSPSLHSWLNRDLIEEHGGTNLYQPCSNNHYFYVDALGLVAVTDIPSIMRANKWTVGAQLMDYWFSNPVNTASRQAPASTGIVKMDWILQFERAKKKYDEIFSRRLFATDNAKKVVRRMAILSRFGVEGRFCDLNRSVLEVDKEYVSHHAVPSALRLDDLNAALGAFSFRIAVSGEINNHCLKVDSVGVYAHDRYDFIDRGFFETKIRSQDLGAWNKKKNTVSMFWGGDTVQNKTFREYQKKSGKGGDFDVFSDVKITELYDWQKFTIPLELKK